jgi:hypothetical protein
MVGGAILLLTLRASKTYSFGFAACFSLNFFKNES